MADHITQVIGRIQKATGYHATEILDEAQPPLQEILGNFALALLREGFEAGLHARPTPLQTGWDFTAQGVNMVSSAHHAFQAFLTQRQQEKEK